MKRILDLHPVLHLNADEALRFTRCGSPEEAAKLLADRTGNTVLVTCGSRGCLIFRAEDGALIRTEAYPAKGKGDAIGAGDSHIGSVIALIKKGFGMEQAVRGANRIASAVVSTRGAVLTDGQFREAAESLCGII